MKKIVLSAIFSGLFLIGLFAQQNLSVQERAALAIKEASTILNITPEQETKLQPVVAQHIAFREKLASTNSTDGMDETNDKFLSNIQSILSKEQYNEYMHQMASIDDKLRSKGIIHY